MAPKTPLLKLTRRFLAIFGSPLGAQKSPKIDFFLKKPSQGALFHRFLLRMSFSSIFRLIFSRFWMKNQWKNICFFSSPPRIFSNMATLTKHCILRYESYFFVFWVFYFFFEKSMKKTIENFTCQKSRKMTPGGPQNRSKIVKKRLLNRQKSPKMPKKSIFWGVDFLMIFWMAKKSEKGGMPIID